MYMCVYAYTRRVMMERQEREREKKGCRLLSFLCYLSFISVVLMNTKHFVSEATTLAHSSRLQESQDSGYLEWLVTKHLQSRAIRNACMLACLLACDQIHFLSSGTQAWGMWWAGSSHVKDNPHILAYRLIQCEQFPIDSFFSVDCGLLTISDNNWIPHTNTLL